jgi:hypothetical protein
MKQCRLCGKLLEEENTTCWSCGYDFNTDSVSPSFKPKPASITGKEEKEKTAKAGGVSSGVKKFALVGLAVVIFSVLYKYHFDINAVFSDASRLFDTIKSGKFAKSKDGKKKGAKAEKIELINVRSFISPTKVDRYKDLKIEGISFDPGGKSFIIVNGRVISKGETFENVTVKKVNTDTVELIVAGKAEVLKVNQRIAFPGK